MIRHLSANIILIGFFWEFFGRGFHFWGFSGFKIPNPHLRYWGFLRILIGEFVALKIFKISNSYFINIVFFTEFKIL